MSSNRKPMIRRDPPTLETSICIGCGFCCNGVLHDQVDVEANDETAVIAAGLTIRDEDGKRVFSQPCPKFSCGTCSIYAARPGVCSAYRCKLLKNVDDGHLNAELARAKISMAKGLIAALASRAPEGATSKARTEVSQRLKTTLGGMHGMEREQAAKTLLDIAVLEHFLDRWFRDAKPGRK
jgi:hypothetical protein